MARKGLHNVTQAVHKAILPAHFHDVGGGAALRQRDALARLTRAVTKTRRGLYAILVPGFSHVESTAEKTHVEKIH